MIIENAKKFTITTSILMLFFVMGVKSIQHNNLQKQANENATYRATIISSVSLLLAQNEISSRQELSNLLEKLDNIIGLTAWQLIGENEQVLSEGPPLEEVNKVSGTINYQDSLYLKISEKQLLTLKLAIVPPNLTNALFSSEDYLLIIVMMIAIVTVGFFQFRWLYQIESYARYVLAHETKPTKTLIEKSDNPISLTINQLLLRNNLLLKDKMDLTDQIRKVTFIDEKTELGNHLFFKAEFEVRLHNHEEAETGLLMILSFKEFADNHQLVLDDEHVLLLANLLRHFIAEIPDALVARLKGFDFALLIPHQSRESIDLLCSRLISQLDKAIFDKTPLSDHFVDIGISSYKQGFNYYKILAEADMALRNAQLQGANSWYMYGEELVADKIRGSLKWRSFLQHSLEKRQIQLFGQKIQSFNQHKVEHIEIYIRLKDGDTLLTADTFLPMANQCGLAVEFDRQVIDSVIKHCLYQTSNEPKMLFTINLFINSLLEQKFITWLVKKLSSYPALCQQIHLEMKESQVNPNLEILKKVFVQLSELGIRWSIDRFGSPNEDISFLDVLPITQVKLDRRIVHNIHQDKNQQLLLQSLLINLKRKNIEVYADGVESEADANYLLSSGIQGAQGFYYGSPERLIRIEKQLKAS